MSVFWRKKDVRSLFERCGVASSLIAARDWQGYKADIVGPVLDNLNGASEGLGPLRRVLSESLAYKDGNHLLWCTDGQKRRREAERNLEHLRLLVKDYESTLRERESAKQERLQRIAQSRQGSIFLNKLTTLRERFLAFYSNLDHRRRGYGLESLLYDLFDVFDLSPRGPFRRVGEQIDGAFAMGNDNYLLEAKWQEAAAILGDLRDLDGAVGSSLDNTLGLFISINGFSRDAIDSYVQGSRPKIICMDGGDVMLVVENRIELPELLQRKKDLASEKRRVFVPAEEILRGAA